MAKRYIWATVTYTNARNQSRSKAVRLPLDQTDILQKLEGVTALYLMPTRTMALEAEAFWNDFDGLNGNLIPDEEFARLLNYNELQRGV